LVALICLPLTLKAENTGGNSGKINYQITIANPVPIDPNTGLPGLLTLIIEKIINPIGAVVAVLMVMYAGFMYVTAQGDPGKIKTAHQAILWAVVGAAILLGANLIALAVKTTVNQLGV
jgi:type IV secretory pathway VirB2 component (pilin)